LLSHILLRQEIVGYPLGCAVGMGKAEALVLAVVATIHGLSGDGEVSRGRGQRRHARFQFFHVAPVLFGPVCRLSVTNKVLVA